jgi:prepilin-type N-terminal cleavage/methylation domain-containing protein
MALHKISTLKGFSLIELIVVIGLITIIAGFGMIVSIDDYRGYSFRSERDIIVSALQKARSQATNNMCYGAACTDGLAHGVYFGTPGHYIIFQGTTYSAGDPINEDIVAKNASAVVTGVTSVLFTELSGNAIIVPSVPGSVSVTDVGNHTSFITIEPSGRIWWSN